MPTDENKQTTLDVSLYSEKRGAGAIHQSIPFGEGETTYQPGTVKDPCSSKCRLQLHNLSVIIHQPVS